MPIDRQLSVPLDTYVAPWVPPGAIVALQRWEADLPARGGLADSLHFLGGFGAATHAALDELPELIAQGRARRVSGTS
jgi:hypothetical protein